jgi:hypothetical protein
VSPAYRVRGPFFGLRVHGKNFCPTPVANASKRLQTLFQGCEVKQREFPFLAVMPAPVAASREAVAMCHSEADAIAISTKFRGGYSDRWFAKRLGISPTYFCHIKQGARDVPSWLVKPFCTLAGTTLLAQYQDLQQALDRVEQRNTVAIHRASVLQALRIAA